MILSRYAAASSRNPASLSNWASNSGQRRRAPRSWRTALATHAPTPIKCRAHLDAARHAAAWRPSAAL
eukprot:1555830-Pyramimonas_sp.AAC.1